HAELQLLSDILHGADLDELLKRHQPFTVFAPTKDALEKLGPIQIQYLRHAQGKDDLDLTIQHHVHAGVKYNKDFAPGSTGLSTLGGQDVMILNVDNKLMVDNAEVIRRDILASNGVIHTVSRPLLPSALVWTAAKYLIGSNAAQFVTALREAGLGRYIDDPNGSYTIFAVRDEEGEEEEEGKPKESFWSQQEKTAALGGGGGGSRDLLQYHIVRGSVALDDLKDGQLLKTELSTFELNEQAQRSKVTIQRSRRQKHLFLNGVEIVGEPLQVGKSMIYFIAKPLHLPPKLIKSIKVDDGLSLFSQALSETGLGHRLSDARGVTVFAPTDEAWKNLGVVSNYLMDKSSIEHLEHVVLYTTGPRVVYSPDIKQGRTTLKTAADEILVVEKTNDGAIYVGEGRLDQNAQVGGRVVESDLLVDSGVVHKVASVALPPSLEITLYNVLQGAGAHTFLSAFELANITSILKDWDQDYTIFAPSDQAFEEAGLSNALNDRDFVARLVRLHVIPGRIIRLEEDIDVDEASLLNNDAKLSFRDIHGDGKKFGVRVKGARSKKEARVVGFGKAHPARPIEEEEDDVGGYSSVNSATTKPWRLAKATQYQQQQSYEDYGFYEPREQYEPEHGGVLYVIDRVLLPSDVSRLGQAWIWVCMVMLALLVAMALCLLTAIGVHALVQEIRQHEGYDRVPQDEEAGAVNGAAVAGAAAGSAGAAGATATEEEGGEGDATARTVGDAPPPTTNAAATTTATDSEGNADGRVVADAPPAVSDTTVAAAATAEPTALEGEGDENGREVADVPSTTASAAGTSGAQPEHLGPKIHKKKKKKNGSKPGPLSSWL
ncbi:hypothetical protein DFQ27_005327, partial [Actinomortierella ambigua]